MSKLKGLSLFANVGIAEAYMKDMDRYKKMDG